MAQAHIKGCDAKIMLREDETFIFQMNLVRMAFCD